MTLRLQNSHPRSPHEVRLGIRSMIAWSDLELIADC
jgi:hypothetical protein